MLLGALVMTVNIIHTHHHKMGDLALARYSDIAGPGQIAFLCQTLLSQHRGSVKLCAVIPDAQTQCETEGIAEPVNRLAHVRIRQDWNDRAPWYRAVRQHAPSLITIFHTLAGRA